jgi:hypothetical protein
LTNPPVGAKIDTDGLVTWTPALDEAPSTNIFTVIVTDDGSPPMSATNSFTVVVLAPPAPPTILSLNLAGNFATLTWTAVAGRTYRIQCTEDLTSTNWNDLLPEVPATGPACSCSRPTDGVSHRFYRVLLVQ